MEFKRKWAWRLFPHVYRLHLMFAHRSPRGCDERNAWAWTIANAAGKVRLAETIRIKNNVIV